jgi:hypothetical protein
MALKDELEDKASKNSAKDNWYTNENKKPSENDSSELKSRTPEEEKKDKRERWNSNCVNAQLADIAGVSTAKVFRYKEIIEHGSSEEITEVGVLYLCNST